MLNGVKKRKGITPVIAIVLLLLITVGAVGVVYTQFSGLISQNPGEQVGQQQRLQNAKYSIVSAVKDTDTGDADGVSDSSIKITIRNDADIEWNLSQNAVVKAGPDGNPPQALGSLPSDFREENTMNCPGTDNAVGNGWILSEGESKTCDTDVSWPGATEDPTAITMVLKDQEKASYSCSIDSGGQDLC